ncbi:hypothetical protein JGU66_31410 [Myxococcaceae bacterium JPH2]|nr:hypothetical protein [Myxococcaceae bacterium JPH2]
MGRGIPEGWRQGVVLIALALSPAVQALPSLGQHLPEFPTRDLRSQPHDSRELDGRPTLVVIITDKDAGPAMRAWFDTAQAHVPAAVHRASFISVRAPFFVSDGSARGKARKQVPPRFWTDTWMDKNGDMARRLDLPVSRTPYVLALDAEGRVTASLHAPVSAPESRAIWTALQGR